MQSHSPSSTVSAHDVASLPPEKIAKLVNGQGAEIAALRHQLEWFKRQIFGQKSERRLVVPDANYAYLGDVFAVKPEAGKPGKKTHVAAHDRVKKPSTKDDDESTLFFDEDKVPVETIYVDPDAATGLKADEFEVISEKVTYRLAQRPGSYVVTRFVRPVIKLRESSKLVSIAAPAAVINGSRTDVSLQAGVLIDKFAYHQPL